MSASLVGSEMCIRDRKDAVRDVNGLPRPSRPWDPHTTRRAPHRLQTVSYTHLTLPTICSV
eukprot:8563133-Alexandrium_andersonii.AAC.1